MVESAPAPAAGQAPVWRRIAHFSFLACLYRHRLRADFLALAAGALTVAAFAPFSLAPLALVGPGLLFLAWEAAPGPRRMVVRGYLYGLGLFGCGVSWIYNSLSLFGEAIAPWAAPLTGLFVALLALVPAGMGWLAAGFRPLPRSVRLLVAWPALWVLFEWLRSWLFTGFPWLLLGDSQVGFAPGALAPVLGVLGVSGFLTMLGGLLALAAAQSRLLPRVFAIGLIPALWFAAGGLYGIRWTHADGDPVRVSLVQGNIAQKRKFDPGEFELILHRYAELTRAHWRSRLIVWPETAVPTLYRYVKGDYLDPLAAAARRHGDDLVLGIFRRQGRRIYNAVVAMGVTRPEFYEKHHLVPFGEYMPWPQGLGWLYQLMQVPMSSLSPGRGGYLVHAAGIPIGVSICYEVAYESLVRRALPKARLLLNVSNDAWFGDSIEPYQQLQMARMRALEFGRYMLVAMNTGPSAVIAPDGHIVTVGQRNRTEVISAEVRPMAGLTPFARLGEGPVVGAALFTALLAAGLAWRGRHSRSDERERA